MNLNFGTQTMAQQLPTKLAELIRKRMLQEEGVTKTRKAIRAKTITANDQFTLCIDDSSITAAANMDDTGTLSIFTRGKCAYIAYRLHELTELPYAIWTDTTKSHWSGHLAIQLPNGTYLDLAGTHTNAQILNTYQTIDLTPEPTIHHNPEPRTHLPNHRPHARLLQGTRPTRTRTHQLPLRPTHTRRNSPLSTTSSYKSQCPHSKTPPPPTQNRVPI